jgi:hypothetical protein
MSYYDYGVELLTRIPKSAYLLFLDFSTIYFDLLKF